MLMLLHQQKVLQTLESQKRPYVNFAARRIKGACAATEWSALSEASLRPNAHVTELQKVLKKTAQLQKLVKTFTIW